MSAAPTSPSGVRYRLEDCLGVGRRFLIDLIDVPVAVLLSALAVGAARTVAPEAAGDLDVVLLLSSIVWFAYFVILKRSTFRTLGYVAAGARIVDLQGGRPSLFSLVGRLMFTVLGPINIVFDLFWTTGDASRQALRDKFASTYVIRQSASPMGVGTVVLKTYMFWGMTFLFKEVELPRTP